MKIETSNLEQNNEPLIGAQVVFTKHSKKNQEHVGAGYWLTLGKIYTVVGYSHYPEVGSGPQILCDDDSVGDVPMMELDYDIVNLPKKAAAFALLQSPLRVKRKCSICGTCLVLLGDFVATTFIRS